jgi:voltage-gated potassium channel
MTNKKDHIFSIKNQSSRSGLSSIQFVSRRAKGHLQTIIDSAPFEISIALLILVSVILVFAEFFLPPGQELDDVIMANDILTWVFVVELTLRWYVAPSKKVFFKNYWVDILAVLPVLRFFRSFRLLRLLRILRLSRAFLILLRRTGWLTSETERSIGLFSVLFITSVVLVVCWTLIILTIEAPPSEVSISVSKFMDRIWSTTFLFISGEVVDDLPDSPWSRLVEVLVAVSGLLLFAVFVGAVSSMMTNYWKVKMDEKELTLDDLEGHTIICGWDRLAAITLAELEISRDLWQRGVVVVAETSADIIAESRIKNSKRMFHINDDFTKMDVLERAGTRRARAAIILSDRGNNLTEQVRDARTVLAALTIEKINPEIFTCAELIDDVNATHLRMAGVEEIVSRANISAGLFASAVVNKGISTVVSDLLSQKDGAYLRKLDVPDNFIGKQFIEVFNYFKHEHDATILALDYAEDGKNYLEHHINPSNDHILKPTDKIILVASVNSKFNKLPS